jgi:hypothetical protein
MRILLISAALVFFISFSKGQSLQKDLTTVFAFQVHSIDDFFDRFNLRKNTAFLSFIKKKYPDYELKREAFVNSLFNSFNPDMMNNPQKVEFIVQVTDTSGPAYIKYSDHDWFAELNCRVFYKGKPKNMKLVLKVEKTKKNEYMWSVVSASADFLKPPPSNPQSNIPKYQMVPDTASKRFSLSPVSHGIDFMNLDNFFDNKNHLNDYLSTEYFSPELYRLLLLIKNSKVKFDQINSTSYHLLQIKGWVLVVEYFNRSEKNSGWLINRLLQVSPEEKEAYLKTNLHIQKR